MFCLMLHIFRAAVQYTEIVTSNLLHNIYYLLHLHVSATGRGHLQGATSFLDVDIAIYAI
jgi:hypothetical protein